MFCCIALYRLARPNRFARLAMKSLRVQTEMTQKHVKTQGPGACVLFARQSGSTLGQQERSILAYADLLHALPLPYFNRSTHLKYRCQNSALVMMLGTCRGSSSQQHTSGLTHAPPHTSYPDPGALCYACRTIMHLLHACCHGQGAVSESSA
jgi:hypothetical protein